MGKYMFSSTTAGLITAFIIGCTEAPDPSGPEAGKRREVLVDPGWLERHLEDPQVRVVDLSGNREVYDSGHIAGAVYVDWKTDITDPDDKERYNVAPPERVAELLGSHGITREATVVLYDDMDNRLAARMFWILRYYGHDDVRILNGGRLAWRSAGKPLVSDVPVYGREEYVVNYEDFTARTDLGYIRLNLDNPEVVIVDGRPPAQYSGEMPGKVFHTGKEHARRGHIPGAINIFWRDNLAADGRFKSADELRRLYEGSGVTGDKTVVTVCNEGLHAAPPWFVLKELLGYPDVRLYDDSMAEWANNPDMPVASSN